MAEEKKITRRGFFSRFAAFTASLFSLWFLYKYLSPDTSGGNILIQTKEADVPEGGAIIFPEKSIAALTLPAP